MFAPTRGEALYRRAKIVCTLGPATESQEKIGQLMDEGMDVARLNFSHNDPDYHRTIFQRVRAESEKRGRPVAVLQDLQGPKIRIGRFANGGTDLVPGATFTVTTRAIVGDDRVVSTVYQALPGDVKPGDALLLDDGQISLEVTEVVGEDVTTRVTVGGRLKNNKGINLPGVKVSAPALTEKDKEHLKFGVDLGVDFVALSFVRHPDDVREARALATREGRRRVPIIAKLEKPEAIERLDEIIDVSDGIMVARGDLGVELGPEKVPLIQKRVIEATNAKGKVVITATQMLESMIENPRPTRAEASDVANAVLDGSDALMLSGETAAGAYPILTVRTMARIISEIEVSARYRTDFGAQSLDLQNQTNAIAHAAVVAARQLRIKTIALFSESGAVARLISEYRPEAAIIALTTDASTYRRLQLYWGVTPVLVAPARSTDEMITRIESYLRGRNFAKAGETVAITMGVPLGSGESTNLLKLHRIS
ncbi:MAG: pyruvate kinase [Deltaproteobacteria bacterium]|nr:pyruvate kinase [Deltaproteobacteria bacterium]